MDTRGAHELVVSGRVQGVGFRWFVERHARKLGLRGHVRNLVDGRVEVFAQGDREGLEELRRRLSEGPDAARVDHVECKTVPLKPDLSSFRVRF